MSLDRARDIKSWSDGSLPQDWSEQRYHQSKKCQGRETSNKLPTNDPCDSVVPEIGVEFVFYNTRN